MNRIKEKLASISVAIEEIQQGRKIILLDDKNYSNQYMVMIPLQAFNEDSIKFTKKYGKNEAFTLQNQCQIPHFQKISETDLVFVWILHQLLLT